LLQLQSLLLLLLLTAAAGLAERASVLLQRLKQRSKSSWK
jgi:hypothetical protein